MPRYGMLCPNCGCEFDVIRSMRRAPKTARCGICRSTARRVFVRFNTIERMECGEHFNRGLGMPIRDRNHLDMELKRQGAVLYEDVYDPKRIDNLPEDYTPSVGDFKRSITKSIQDFSEHLTAPVFVDEEQVA